MKTKQQQQPRFRAKSIKTRIETRSYYEKATTATGFRAKSIKTRIETAIVRTPNTPRYEVLEQNPSKQGLKQEAFRQKGWYENGFRAKSIKTRIETQPF